jgi:predicted metalloprotease with PDZ domain
MARPDGSGEGTLRRLLLRALVLLMPVVALAQVPSPDVPPPRDRAYAPGEIRVHVDARDVTRRILRVRETLPVRAGRLTLLYPQWLPGNHAPRGPIEQLTGLVINGGGARIAWRRDPLNVYAFHLDVPAGVTQLDIEFQVATPQASDQGRVIATANLLGLQWNQVVLYPAGYHAWRIVVRPSVELPAGWSQASALSVAQAAGERIDFNPAVLEDLVDSPLFAGRHRVTVDLAPGEAKPVRLNVFGEAATQVEIKPGHLATHRAIVRQAYAALGPPPYDRYDFLLALSDGFGGIGLEHHRSSENSQRPDYFTATDEDVSGRDLLAHEFTHAWNGKHRRPARLWTPNYNVPMQDDLLWVYEGMTQYYGMVLTARAGLWTPAFARDALAATAATYSAKRPGRSWRPLEDTTFQPIITPRRPLSWVSWQRTEDYYSESALLWLDVDTRLRERSGGARSLDDFAQAFFAAQPTQGRVAPYEFRDVAATLTRIEPREDWARLLRERVGGTSQPLLDGFERAGWRLEFGEEPNNYIRDAEKDRKVTDLSYSLGLVVNAGGNLTEVVWDSPAFDAGLTINTTLVAVNGDAYSADVLKAAIRAAAKAGGAPLELLVKNQDRFRTVRIDYRGGLKYPRLVRIDGRPDLLETLLRAK